MWIYEGPLDIDLFSGNKYCFSMSDSAPHAQQENLGSIKSGRFQPRMEPSTLMGCLPHLLRLQDGLPLSRCRPKVYTASHTHGFSTISTVACDTSNIEGLPAQKNGLLAHKTALGTGNWNKTSFTTLWPYFSPS